MMSDFMTRVSMLLMAMALFTSDVTIIQRNVVLAIGFMLIITASTFRTNEINKAERRISKLETDVEFWKEIVIRLKNENNKENK